MPPTAVCIPHGTPLLEKAEEFHAAYEQAAELFEVQREWFPEVEHTETIDLSSVDIDEDNFNDIRHMVAFNLRKTQALRYASRSGVHIASDTTISLIGDIERTFFDMRRWLRTNDRPPSAQSEQRCSYALEIVGRLADRANLESQKHNQGYPVCFT